MTETEKLINAKFQSIKRKININIEFPKKDGVITRHFDNKKLAAIRNNKSDIYWYWLRYLENRIEYLGISSILYGKYHTRYLKRVSYGTYMFRESFVDLVLEDLGEIEKELGKLQSL